MDGDQLKEHNARMSKSVESIGTNIRHFQMDMLDKLKALQEQLCTQGRSMSSRALEMSSLPLLAPKVGSQPLLAPTA